MEKLNKLLLSQNWQSTGLGQTIKLVYCIIYQVADIPRRKTKRGTGDRGEAILLGKWGVEQKRGSNPEANGREHVQDRSLSREGAGMWGRWGQRGVGGRGRADLVGHCGSLHGLWILLWGLWRVFRLRWDRIILAAVLKINWRGQRWNHGNRIQ